MRVDMSYMKFTGAMLLLVSCGGMGGAWAASLRRGIEDTSELIRSLERMETEICVRCRTIPETAAMLENEYPRLYSGLGDMSALLRDKSFASVWKDHFHAMDLPAGAEKAICTLGEDLACGAKPDAAFTACCRQLNSAVSEMKEQLDKNGKVYIAAGFAAGCLLVIAAA